MPGRSKPRAKRPSDPAGSMLIAENSILKMKNLELAKALTECKMQCARLIKENSDMQKQVFGIDCENLKMKECFKRIDSRSRSCLDNFILISNDMAEIVQNAMHFLQPPLKDYYSTPVSSKLNMSVTSENTQKLSINRTRLVKPMISGHTILNPKINLQRVPREQMEHLMNTLNDDESTDSDDEPNVESPTSLHSNLERQNQEPGENDNESFENGLSSALSDDMELELHDHGLDTLQEVDENVSHLDSPLQLHHGRLQSNSFEDIKVSMAPLKRRCYNWVDKEDSSEPCIASNSSLHSSATNDSSSDSTNLSTDSNNGNLNNTTPTSGHSKSMIYDNATIADTITLRNNSVRKSLDMADDFNNSDAIPEYANLKNLSTVVNSNLDISDYQNNLSIISSHSPIPKGSLQEHVGKEFSNQSMPSSCSNVNTTLINSYDPLEGSSSLLDNLHQQTATGSKMLQSSTPYTPMNINKRQKKSKPSESYESLITTPDVSKVSPPSKITRRKIKTENQYQSRHLFDYNSDEVNLQKFRKCSVRICQLPCNKLSIKCRQKSEVPTPAWNQDQSTSRVDNKTPNTISNECSPNSSKKEAEPLKTPKLEKISPYKRGRRNVKVTNLKEPSLRKYVAPGSQVGSKFAIV